MVSDSTGNSLHRVAAASSVLLGLFFIAGALGHFAATWPASDAESAASGFARFNILLPGLVLLATGLLNIGVSRALWSGTAWSLHVALIGNALTTAYLAYLLSKGVPNHPIGFFLALVCCFIIVLGAIRLGLVWPAAKT